MSVFTPQSALAELVEETTSKLLSIIAENGVPIIVEHEWRPDQKERVYYRHSYQNLFFPELFQTAEPLISKSEKYLRCKTLFESDSIYGPHLNNTVGANSSRRKITFRDVVYYATKQMFDDTDRPFLDQAKLNTIIIDLHEEFSSAWVNVEEITPLFGFQSDIPRIELDDDLSIEKLSKKDISYLLNQGIPLGHSVNADRADLPFPYAIFRRWKSRKTFGENSNATGESDLEIVPQTIAFLQLFKYGTLHPVTTVRRSSGFFSSGTAFSLGHFRPGLRSSYRLTGNEMEAFRTFWKDLYSARNRIPGNLKLALRRYSLSDLRPNIEDSMVDLLIAAEAIFLTDSDAELSYRLSHRAAHFLSPTDRSKQREIFTKMKKAYEVRSKIVHGTEIKNLKLPIKKDGNRMMMWEFYEETRGLIRESLIQMLSEQRKSSDTKFKADWMSIVFSE